MIQQIELMKKKLAAARKRIENGDGAKEGEEQEEVRLRKEYCFCLVSPIRYICILQQTILRKYKVKWIDSKVKYKVKWHVLQMIIEYNGF